MSLVDKADMRQLTVKILITDKEKARFLWELMRTGFNQENPLVEQYGILVTALADGDLFAENTVLTRALEKVEARDLDSEDFLSKAACSYGDDDDDEFPDYEALAEEALNQADNARDKWNKEIYKNPQQTLPLAGV